MGKALYWFWMFVLVVGCVSNIAFAFQGPENWINLVSGLACGLCVYVHWRNR